MRPRCPVAGGAATCGVRCAAVLGHGSAFPAAHRCGAWFMDECASWRLSRLVVSGSAPRGVGKDAVPGRGRAFGRGDHLLGGFAGGIGSIAKLHLGFWQLDAEKCPINHPDVRTGVKIGPEFLQNRTEDPFCVATTAAARCRHRAGPRSVCRNGTNTVTISRKAARTPILSARHTANAALGRGYGGYL